MDFLEESFGAQTAPVELHDLVSEPLAQQSLPQGSIRNRAATAAMLTPDPSKAVENYQLLMREGEEGGSALYDQVKSDVLAQTQKNDMSGIMSVLADPSVSMDKKREIVQGVKNSQFLKDSGTILHTNSLTAPSSGENPDQENARLSSADAIREIYDARNKIQGLVNAHGATLDSASIGTVGDMAALWMVPFANSISVGKVNKGIEPISLWKTLKGFIAPGSTTQDIRSKLENMPPEKRVEYAQSILSSIKNNSGIIFGNDNQFAQYEKASAIFEQGGYSSVQEWMDNISPLLDAVGIGQLLRGGSKAKRFADAAGKADPLHAEEIVHPATWELVDENPIKEPFLKLQDNVKRIEMNSVIRLENPASPANIVQIANPEKARGMHEAVQRSEGNEISEALYGVSKEQALVNDTFPQILTESGAVTAKATDIERNLRTAMGVDDTLMDIVNNTGAVFYTQAEKAQARANVVNYFSSAEGIVVNDAMSSFSIDGGRIKIDAVYGTSEGGFLKPEDALQQAMYALRSRGVRDEDVTLLKMEGIDYVPVEIKDVYGKEGNYVVRISAYHDIGPKDISSFEQFDVKRNLLDRIGPLVSQSNSSASRYVFDASSMLHPIYTGAASNASDATAKFDKAMLEIASEYSDQYIALKADRRAKVDDYIREANFNGIKLDQTDLVTRGFNQSEIDTLKSWRKFWDAHFYLENYDIVKTMNAQGYELFRNKNTELYVHPISKNQNVGALYDPASDTVVVHSKAEGDMLYAAGGTYAKLRRPTQFGGDTAEYMIVRNTPTEYTRKFNSGDQVLNYREGYFQIQYKAPKFVDEVSANGTRTVAVAGDTKEAEFFAKRMQATNPGMQYQIRGDTRALQRDSDAWWDLNSASGRIAQRHRGKLLEDASGLNHLGDGSYILDPVDSAVRAAKSIAGRTVTRPMLEAAKARFIAQYGDVIPSNGMGGKAWPKNVSQITGKGAETSKLVSDARTTYEYINYLENGYINTIDTVFKWGLNAVSDLAGSAGLSKIERGAMNASETSVTGIAKNSVFMAYIGSNVLRQWVVQPHQILRTLAYNPIGWANGQVEKLSTGYVAGKLNQSIANNADIKAFTKFVDDSGLLDAVDKSNLVKGTLMEAADYSSNAAVKGLKKGMEFTRRVGFDLGEQANLIGHAAAVYERRTRLGIDLSSKEARDAAYSEIRAISYDMNFAGDMPYNQTSPSIALQFLQVPHKALLQMTNRRIAPLDRLRMSGGDLVMWGGPALLISELFGGDILPDHPMEREAFLWGVESALLNNMFTKLSGEKVNIDYSSLAPYDMTGWSKFFEAMYTGGTSQVFMNSPAGQLFLKDGGRVRNASAFVQKGMAEMARYFGMIEDIDEDAPTFLEVMREVAKISSGFNNAYKAKMLLDARKRFDQYGGAVDKEVGTIEAWHQAFGFGTADTRDLYKISLEMSKDNKKYKDEVLKVYNDVKRYYYSKLETENADPVFITKVTGRMMKIFENDPVAQGIIQHQLALDMTDKDQALIGLFLKHSSIPSIHQSRDQIKNMPITDEQKQLMLQRLDDVKSIQDENSKEE